MSARKRRQPQLQRVDLSATVNHPHLREMEAEYSLDAAQFGDVIDAAVFGALAGGFAGLVAHGLAALLQLPGYSLQMVVVGAVGLVALLIRAGQIADSRRTRQWATFDRQPETTKLPEFVPVADSGRTLVLDTELRGKVVQWAQLLPAANYSLVYRRWVDKWKFTRTEFDRVRAMMAAQGLMKGNEITDAGRAAVGRWSVGNLTADEVHGLRGDG